MSALISIIVPVYNFEDCLGRCVDSILGQTYSDIELILVDDGSRDQSGAICDAYQSLDPRVKVVHKKNGGTSEARNYGLELASGEYIGFVDGDDFIEPDFYQVLYDLIVKHGTDISMVSYREVWADRAVEKADTGRTFVLEREDAVKGLLLDQEIQNYVWNKLYKRELFREIRFPVGVVYDDINIMYELFRESRSIVYRETAKYNYCIRETSVIHTDSHKKREDGLLSILKRFYEVERDFPSLKQYNAYALVLWMIRIYTYTVKGVDPEDGFIKERMPMFCRLYEENPAFILERLKPLKRVILFIMLWDIEKGKEAVKKL
ncbi:MAG: glycosyltransferase [Eubacteriales bacterium]|nr:glycosyltransferase [Eubacteriales bacterium]